MSWKRCIAWHTMHTEHREHSVGLKEDEGSEEHSVIQKEHPASPTIPISPKARRPLTSKNCLSRMRQGVFHLSLDFSSLEMQSPESAINTPHAFDCHEVPAASIGVTTRWRFLHILHIHAYPCISLFASIRCMLVQEVVAAVAPHALERARFFAVQFHCEISWFPIPVLKMLRLREIRHHKDQHISLVCFVWEAFAPLNFTSLGRHCWIYLSCWSRVCGCWSWSCIVSPSFLQ